MTRKIILTCAVTGAMTPLEKNPALPITPEQISTSAIEAANAGAAVAHIHVRNPETGTASLDPALYREVVERIRDSDVDVLINLTTGVGGRYVPGDPDPAVSGEGTTLSSPEIRTQHIAELRPDICSLDMGSMNFGNFVFVNTPGHLVTMAETVRSAGVKPELEVFDSGHIRLAKHMIENGQIDTPALFQICLGIPWGAEASSRSMIHMLDQLPADAHWAGFGIGATEFPMVAQAVLLGGNVRVGLEDNLYMERGVLASSNAALVEKAVSIVNGLGAEVATAAEARAILGLPGG